MNERFISSTEFPPDTSESFRFAIRWKKHTMIQRNLWAMFDWSVEQDSALDAAAFFAEENGMRKRRLADVLRRLVLE